MKLLIENINEVILNLERELIKHNNNLIFARDHTDNQYFRLYLNEEIELDDISSEFFNYWFSKNFDYLKTKYNSLLKNKLVLRSIERDVHESFNYLIQTNRLKESFLTTYFEIEDLND